MRHPALSLDEPMVRRLEDLCRALPARLDRQAPLPAHETLISERIETSWLRSWHFPTSEAARAWNQDWERVLEEPGWSHPGLLAPVEVVRANPPLELVARIASAVVHEEIRAGTPPPAVEPGQGFELSVVHQYTLRPFPHRREELTLRLAWSVTRPEGEPLWSVDCVRDYDLRHLPGGAPWVLLTPSRRDSLEATAGPIGS